MSLSTTLELIFRVYYGLFFWSRLPLLGAYSLFLNTGYKITVNLNSHEIHITSSVSFRHKILLRRSYQMYYWFLLIFPLNRLKERENETELLGGIVNFLLYLSELYSKYFTLLCLLFREELTLHIVPQ